MNSIRSLFTLVAMLCLAACSTGNSVPVSDRGRDKRVRERGVDLAVEDSGVDLYVDRATTDKRITDGPRHDLARHDRTRQDTSKSDKQKADLAMPDASPVSQPELVATLTTPREIVSEGTDLFVADDNYTGSGFLEGKVFKVTKSGFTVTPLATQQRAPRDLVVDSAKVYWLTSDNKVMWVDRASPGTPAALVTATGYLPAMLGDAQYLYYCTAATLTRIDKTSLASDDLTSTGSSSFVTMALDGTDFYLGAGASIYKVPKAGGNLTWHMWATDILNVQVDDTQLYWIADTTNNFAIKRAPKAGGSSTTVYEDASSTSEESRLAVDATDLYFTNTSLGFVYKVPKSGGTPVKIASGQPAPYGIAVDATHVYWTNYKGTSGGTVMRLKK